MAANPFRYSGPFDPVHMTDPLPRLWENTMERLEVLGLANLLDRFRDRDSPTGVRVLFPGAGMYAPLGG